MNRDQLLRFILIWILAVFMLLLARCPASPQGFGDMIDDYSVLRPTICEIDIMNSSQLGSLFVCMRGRSGGAIFAGYLAPGGKERIERLPPGYYSLTVTNTLHDHYIFEFILRSCSHMQSSGREYGFEWYLKSVFTLELGHDDVFVDYPGRRTDGGQP